MAASMAGRNGWEALSAVMRGCRLVWETESRSWKPHFSKSLGFSLGGGNQRRCSDRLVGSSVCHGHDPDGARSHCGCAAWRNRVRLKDRSQAIHSRWCGHSGLRRLAAIRSDQSPLSVFAPRANFEILSKISEGPVEVQFRHAVEGASSSEIGERCGGGDQGVEIVVRIDSKIASAPTSFIIRALWVGTNW